MQNNEEKMRILKMIQEGKITAEQGMKLLEAINEAEGEPKVKPTESTPKGDYIRIRITDLTTGKEKVKFRVPIALAHIIKALIPPQEIEKLKAQGINLNLLFDSIGSGKIGKLLDVTDKENNQSIEIVIE